MERWIGSTCAPSQGSDSTLHSPLSLILQTISTILFHPLYVISLEKIALCALSSAFNSCVSSIVFLVIHTFEDHLIPFRLSPFPHSPLSLLSEPPLEIPHMPLIWEGGSPGVQLAYSSGIFHTPSNLHIYVDRTEGEGGVGPSAPRPDPLLLRSKTVCLASCHQMKVVQRSSKRYGRGREVD